MKYENIEVAKYLVKAFDIRKHVCTHDIFRIYLS